MKKFKWFLRFDKEEKWLEKMARQGWLLSRKAICYEFVKSEPEEKTIRIDFRDYMKKEDFMDYCSMFEDSGWKHIAGTRSSGTQYFLKLNQQSTEDIFSDVLSRAGRYERLSNMWLACAIIFVPLALSMKTGGWINWDTLFTPREWYLTPGLWELSGFSFWCSFLFETPFALMRGIGWLMPVIAIMLCAATAIKSRLLYYTGITSEEN